MAYVIKGKRRHYKRPPPEKFYDQKKLNMFICE